MADHDSNDYSDDLTLLGQSGVSLTDERDRMIAQIRRVLIDHRAGPLTRVPVTRTMAEGWYASVLRDVGAVLDGTYREPEPKPPTGRKWWRFWR